jgi:hypothetical protein
MTIEKNLMEKKKRMDGPQNEKNHKKTRRQTRRNKNPHAKPA